VENLLWRTVMRLQYHGSQRYAPTHMRETEEMLKAEKLTKRYNGTFALKELDLEVDRLPKVIGVLISVRSEVRVFPGPYL